MRPFLLQDGDEDQVQLVEESAFTFQLLFGLGVVDDQVDDEISNSYEREGSERRVLLGCRCQRYHLGIGPVVKLSILS